MNEFTSFHFKNFFQFQLEMKNNPGSGLSHVILISGFSQSVMHSDFYEVHLVPKCFFSPYESWSL